MKRNWQVFCGIFFLILIFLPRDLAVNLVDDNPYRHIETLDKDGKYQLEWLVDWEKSRVIFNVTVQTKGYVGLGLSRKGKMSGADIVIGGVLPNGQSYFSDRHAVANQLPVEDESQDWILHEAWEKDAETYLSFSRPFETCDEDHDFPISGDVTALLWAYGEKDDDIQYHYQNRGVFYSYLLDADLTPRELKVGAKHQGGEHDSQNEIGFGDWKIWNIGQTQVIPVNETTYMCSIHRIPINQKHHVVGFRPIYPTELERRHIHHFLLHRCTPPDGQSASRLFQHLVGHKEECYLLHQPMGLIPTQYCTEIFHVSAVGQKPNFFPEHVGLPIFRNEYFMLQMHYDNPALLPSIQVTTSLDIFHTSRLREHDGGIFGVGALEPGPTSVMIPPNSLAHEIYGHCAPGCTKSMLPPKGIRVFASFLHTHMAGRAVRAIHVRDGKELPWIANDNNFNFNYQQIHILRKERLILPGDTLIYRCVYENVDRNGNVTIGGFSSRNEMCSSFHWYYNKIPDRVLCRSEIRSDEYRNFLQIYNFSWSNSQMEEVVTSPQQNAGLLVSEVGNLRTNWTIAKREQLQEYHRYLPQVSQCPPGAWYATIASTSSSQSQPVPLQNRAKSVLPVKNGNIFPGSTKSSIKNHVRQEKQSAKIQNSNNYEFISTYPKNIVRYQPTKKCAQ